MEESQTSISTGIVTLSVHDSLTFDGVEIAIDPQLFLKRSNSGLSSGQHSRNTSFNSNSSMFTSQSQAIQPSPKLMNTNMASSAMVANPASTNPLANPNNTPMVGEYSPTVHSVDSVSTQYINHNILPGDILEVKVWDKKPYQSQLSPEKKKDLSFQSIPNPFHSAKTEKSILQPKIDGNIGKTSNTSGSQARPPIVPRPNSQANYTSVPKLGNFSTTVPATVPNTGINLDTNGEKSDTFMEAHEMNDRSLNVSEPKQSENSDASVNLIETTLPEMKHARGHSRVSSLDSGSTVGDSVLVGEEIIMKSPKRHERDPLDEISKTHNMRLKFVTTVTENSLKTLKAGGRTKISILKNIAELYGLSSYDLVTITKFDENEAENIQASVEADYVTLSIKDQFISRGEMYQFQQSFRGKWIYSGERLSTSDGIRGVVMDIRNGNEEYRSGFITDDTKITCRSRSARIIWLVQISSEMWDYSSPFQGGDSPLYGDGECEIYFDRFISFVRKLFDEWKGLDVSHSLTVVFFSRTFITPNRQNQGLNILEHDFETAQKDSEGRLYEDHFQVVVENQTRTDWDSLIKILKKAFIRYPLDVGWKITSDYSRLPTFAAQGNLLESINICLNMLQFHYVDRDLHRTGNSIVVVSAGSGVFEVDKGLASITKQRMMDNGIGSDMLSLGLPPLHVSPFMLFKESPDNSNKFDNDWRSYFEIPHWMHLSYVNYDFVYTEPVTEENPDVDDKEGPIYKTLPNGFIVYENAPPKISKKNANETKAKGLTRASEQRQKNLVEGREFADILEACRPRNRGSSTPALFSQLKMFGLLGDRNRMNMSNIIEGDEGVELGGKKEKEWNSLDLDDNSEELSRAEFKRSSSGDLSKLFGNSSNSDLSSYSSTPTSLFANSMSLMLGRSPGHHSHTSLNIQLHNAPTLDISTLLKKKNGDGDDDVSSRRGSRSNSIANSVDSSFGSWSASNSLGEKIDTLEDMMKAMAAYDSSIQYHEVEEPVIENAQELKMQESLHQRTLINEDIKPLHKVSSKNSGIGAAIKEYDIDTAEMGPLGVRRGNFTADRFKKSMNAMSSHNLRSMNPSSRPSSFMGFSLDEHDVGLNISRHSPSNLNPWIGGSTIKSISSTEGNTRFMSASPPISNQDFLATKPKATRTNRSPIREVKQKTRNRIHNSNRNKRSSHHSKRKGWILNPFKQEDEEEILAKRTHNSRRWSHVFPKGEIEFKRRSGPNWNSLKQPAILPTTIDVYPTSTELKDETRYTFKHSTVILDALDLTNFTNHSDLLMEMVRQRIIQDFQLVPQSILAKSDFGIEFANKRNLSYEWNAEDEDDEMKIEKRQKEQPEMIQHVLSMGHRFHIISSNPYSDSVEVVEYLARHANNREGLNTYKYIYKIWMPCTERYQEVFQSFQKFPEEYPWNRLDNMIAGNLDGHGLDDMTKCRRLAFLIVPEVFENSKDEEGFIRKAKRFIDILERLASKKLNIEFETSKMELKQKIERKTETISFIIHSRKQGRYEWIEVTVNKVWKTTRSFRVGFKWLVAGAIKIEAQIHMMQRRCTQFGLTFILAPDYTTNSNWDMNPLVRPESIFVKESGKAELVEIALCEKFGFFSDGNFDVWPRDVEEAYKIKISTPTGRSSRVRKIVAPQYVHRSGTLFVRVIKCVNQSVVFLFLENRKYIGDNQEMLRTARIIFREIVSFTSELNTGLLI